MALLLKPHRVNTYFLPYTFSINYCLFLPVIILLWLLKIICTKKEKVRKMTTSYLDSTSLFQTVDRVEEALLFGREITIDEKIDIANFIANRQGKPHAYANMFAPTDEDLKQDLILFTGEKITSRVGKCHMIAQEASFVLRKLNVQTFAVKEALEKSDSSFLDMMHQVLNNPKYKHEYGTYCCKSCSCGFWLNLGSGGLGNDTDLLKAGLNFLKHHRDSKGQWKGFPYYYTLYVLHTLNAELAKEEILYTAPAIERRLHKNQSIKSKYDLRRHYLLEQIMDTL